MRRTGSPKCCTHRWVGDWVGSVLPSAAFLWPLVLCFWLRASVLTTVGWWWQAAIRTSVASEGDNDEAEKVQRKVAKRVQVVQEILKTEETYVNGLRLIQDLFIPAVTKVSGSKPLISDAIRDEIFMNSDEL